MINVKQLVVFVVIIISGWAFPLCIQAEKTKQAGIAYVYDIKKKQKNPVKGVSISVKGAPPTVSGNKGLFELELDGYEMGTSLSLAKQPYYQGLCVFNKQEVEDNWQVQRHPLRLIMCKFEELELLRQEYYTIGKNAASRRYEKDMSDLQNSIQNEDERAAKERAIWQRYEQVMSNMEKNAEAMARIDQSELGTDMQHVLYLFESGLVEEAEKKLKGMHLENRYNALCKRLEAEKNLLSIQTEQLENLHNQMTAAIAVFRNSGEWDEAARYLKLLADKEGKWNDIIDYAVFCYTMQQFDEAEIYLNGLLSYLDKIEEKQGVSDATYLRKCKVAYCLGEINFGKGLMDNALFNFQESIGYLIKMSKEQGIINRTWLPTNALCIGRIYLKQNEFDKARTWMETAVNGFEQEYEENPSTLWMLEAAKDDLAILYAQDDNKDKKDTAYRILKHFLEVAENKVQKAPDKYNANLAHQLNNMASFLSNDAAHYTEAIELEKRAVDIRRQLYAKNNKEHASLLATSLKNLGWIYYLMGRDVDSVYYEKSLSPSKEAFEMLQQLMNTPFPHAYAEEYRKSVNNMSYLYGALSMDEKRIQLQKKAIEEYRKVENVDTTFLDSRLHLMNVVSEYYLSYKELKDSVKLLDETIQLAASAYNRNPIFYGDNYIIALYLKGRHDAFKNDSVSSDKYWHQCMELLKKQAEIDTEADSSNILIYSFNISGTMNTMKRNNSLWILEKASRIYEELASKNSAKFNLMLGEELILLGMTQAKQGNLINNAVASYLYGIEIIGNKVAEDIGNLNIYLTAVDRVMKFLWKNKKYDDVIRCLTWMKDIMQPYYDNHPEDFKDLCAQNRNELAAAFILQKNFRKGEKMARECIQIYDEEYGCVNLAASLILQGKREEALSVYRRNKTTKKDEFLNGIAYMETENIIPSEYINDVESVKTMLNE
jgi:hypothetical protein